MTDYRNFRLSRLNEPEFCHLKLLFFWPAFGLLFVAVENLWVRRVYHPISCALDDGIPFCEYFVIPYIFWFVFVAGMLIYGLLYDVESFKRMMKFIILTYSIAYVTYLVYPNCQHLRPRALEGDSIFIRLTRMIYRNDTNTNVCPSIHVIGSVAALLCAWKSKRFRAPGWRAAFCVAAGLISASTVFLKQHSVVDVAAAVPVCVIGYICVYGPKAEKIQSDVFHAFGGNQGKNRSVPNRGRESLHE